MYTATAQVSEATDLISFKDFLPRLDGDFRLRTVMLVQWNNEVCRQGCSLQRGLTGNFLVVAQAEPAMKVVQMLSGVTCLLCAVDVHQ